MPSYKRIVSLVPSLTELLIELGMSERLVGRTRFCIHPKQEVEKIEIVGGTKNPRVDKISGLKPDLIVANKEENRKQDIEELREFCEVEVTEIDTIEDALLVIKDLSEKLDKGNEGAQMIEEVMSILEQKPTFEPTTAAYLIWKDPWMTVGGDTYIHDVLKKYALENVYKDESRYPKTSLDELAARNPDVILLSSEPYPFKEKDRKEIQEKCPDSEVYLVNGEWFSWYGARMVSAFTRLNTWRKELG
ncbi:helical backbone metal receptor [Gracilimonas mengyeensis]|uniref:ABC-type Fe3+-hydroxamate transport system, substrate-binding protein n=1 Tax=Gracilimonas mengyeensis TaxID=1302730 RepID=A0A521ENF3_9BACT|nr:helical backbone metal receptor [Gracilimonas mengyeensis]SMO84660.1 ABC-type Fe3+-hydroxamate transport system, substrate-binding protein [Gracilimonas mengyeensis]